MTQRRNGIAVCLVLTVLTLAPFCGKAFHIDDPFYVRIAQHIAQHPADYYGLSINWYGHPSPVYAIHVSPPLVPYYLAAWGICFGWSEISLHIAYIPFALLFVGATYALAARWSQRSLLASLIALFTPVTIVTASNIMLDLPMGAFFIAALALWCAGIDRRSNSLLLAAGILAGLSAMSKYFGLSLIPLLIVYGLLTRKRPGFWMLPLIIPVALFTIEQACTSRLYGTSLFGNAGDIARDAQAYSGAPAYLRVLIGLSFLGGCALPVLLFSPSIRPRARVFIGIIALAVPVTAWVVYRQPQSLPVPSLLQLLVFVAGGIAIFTLAVDDVRAERSAAAATIACWFVGTFVFATCLNWSVTARTFLPLIPAVALLVARRLDRMNQQRSVSSRAVFAPAAIAAVLAVAVAAADYAWANSMRDAATRFSEQAKRQSGNVFFQGHWGWQHYMEEAGCVPFDTDNPAFNPGDFIISPQNNTNVAQIPQAYVHDIRATDIPGPRGLATTSREVGAGFYSDSWGPLPFAFGAIPPDTYYALMLGPPK